MKYSKEFKEEALKLSDEIGLLLQEMSLKLHQRFIQITRLS